MAVSGLGDFPLGGSLDPRAAGMVGDRLTSQNLRRRDNRNLREVPRILTDHLLGPRIAAAGWRVVTQDSHLSGEGEKQDFTVDGLGTSVKAAIIVVTDVALDIAGTEKRLSIGIIDRDGFQGGVMGGAQNALADTNTFAAGFDNAVIRFPLADGSGEDAAATATMFTNGIRLSWDNYPAARVSIAVILIYGEQCTAQAGWAVPNAEEDGPNLIDVGFRPKFLFTLNGEGQNETIAPPWRLQMSMAVSGGQSFALWSQSKDAEATSQLSMVSRSTLPLPVVGSYTESPFVFGTETDLVAFHDQGFQIITDGGTASEVGPGFLYIAVDFGDKEVAVREIRTPASPAIVSYYGAGEQVGFGMMLPTRLGNWDTNNSTARAGVMGLGAFNAAAELMMSSVYDKDAQATSKTGCITASAAITYTDDNGTLETAADLTSLDPDGVTFDYSLTGNNFPIILLTVERDLLAATSGASCEPCTSASTAQEQFIATSAGACVAATTAATAEEHFVASSAASCATAQTAATAEEHFIASSAASCAACTTASSAEEHFLATSDASCAAATTAATAEEQFLLSSDASCAAATTAATAEQQFVATSAAYCAAAESASTAEEHFIASSDAQCAACETSVSAETSYLATSDGTCAACETSASTEEHFIAASAGAVDPCTTSATAEEQFLLDSAGACASTETSVTAEEQFLASSDASCAAATTNSTAEEHFICESHAACAPCETSATCIIIAPVADYEATSNASCAPCTTAVTAEEHFICASHAFCNPCTTSANDIDFRCTEVEGADADFSVDLGAGYDQVDLLEASWDQIDYLGAGASLVSDLGAGYDFVDELPASSC